MKVVAYSIKTYEKQFLAMANKCKHEIMLISKALSAETVLFAEGKDAVLVFTTDDVSAEVIDQLAALGVRYIATRSTATHHLDKDAAGRRGIKLANVPAASPLVIADHTTIPHHLLTSDALQQIANQTIKNLDLWQQNKCVGKACVCAKGCNKI
ncbi:Rossmann-fold NAD(P)-binding domain-containing protein [Mucilaginibacter agri]|uniref:Lactate dehydrogenase n=1 Tax=Mucilaginibacter agri TaxID=2695265 RepID=A0A966DSY9_9SPHI|nr:lactate dehydrogenase [Mucilaginibacter agri]NCD68846.1 lactate dehydrogenase [Mucilaginibacter agri]